MRGRKPKPTAVKVLEGNPGKRVLNAREPQPPISPETFEPPRELAGDPVALAYWQELVPVLRQIRQITDVDRGVLVALCVQWSRYIEATAALQQRDEQGRSRMLIRLEGGTFQQNPYIAIANKSLLLCTKLWIELGLTPSSRSRVHTDGAPIGGDAFSEFDTPPVLVDDDDLVKH